MSEIGPQALKTKKTNKKQTKKQTNKNKKQTKITSYYF
jgi:hypothetical protein